LKRFCAIDEHSHYATLDMNVDRQSHLLRLMAEMGRFAQAVEMARRAIESAVRLGDATTADDIRAQKNPHRAGRPYRDLPGRPQ
jgi:hypothetical protein